MISNHWLFPAANRATFRFSSFKRTFVFERGRHGNRKLLHICWLQQDCVRDAFISLHCPGVLAHAGRSALYLMLASGWGRLLHRGALSFTFYPETTQPCIACGCSHSNEHGSAYLSSWLQCGIGLTREGHRALPYLKRGRGNLCDNSIYFSTGWFASRAGRKRLLEFNRPATSLGRASGPAAGGVLGESLLTPASPHPPSRAGTVARVPAGACRGREGWPVCCG